MLLAGADEVTGLQSDEPPFSLTVDQVMPPAMLLSRLYDYHNAAIQLGFNFAESES